MSNSVLTLEPRTPNGTPVARALRREGRIPGVLYGPSTAPIAFSVDSPGLRVALSGPAGRYAVLEVSLDGVTRHAVIKEFQAHATRGRMLHLDLMEVAMDQDMTALVSVRVSGEAIGVRLGGVLEQVTFEVEMTALPASLPNEILVDVSDLAIGDSLKIADLTAPEGSRFASDPDTLIVVVQHPAAEVEVEVEQVVEVVGEGEPADE